MFLIANIRKPRSAVFAVLTVALIAGLPGCTRVDQTRSSARSESSGPVWPAPPEQARIAYDRSVLRPLDLGLKRSAFTRLGQWLSGSDKGNERLVKPFGLALDELGNLCVTDTGANVVCYYNQAIKKWSRWDKIGKTRFLAPVAVAKRNGIFYVADSSLGSVIAFDESGKLLFTSTNRIGRPTGICVARDRVFVCDAQNHCIVILDLKGNYVGEIGRRGAGNGEFNFPTHISCDQEGNLFVTDSVNSRVQRFDFEGKFLGQIGQLGDGPGQFSRPKGLAADQRGNVYVVDAMFDNVQIFDRSGRLLLHFGSAGSAAGEFWLPNGIVIASDNTIYVADSYNHRIQIFKYVGPS